MAARFGGRTTSSEVHPPKNSTWEPCEESSLSLKLLREDAWPPGLEDEQQAVPVHPPKNSTWEPCEESSLKGRMHGCQVWRTNNKHCQSKFVIWKRHQDHGNVWDMNVKFSPLGPLTVSIREEIKTYDEVYTG